MAMQYKTELHAHTAEVSMCANVPLVEVVSAYKKAGYRTLVLTDHMSHWTFGDKPTTDWEGAVNHFLQSYRAAQAFIDENFSVLLGMELCFDTKNFSDYLVYGVTEDFLYAHPDLMQMGIVRFSKLAKEAGLLVVQAHPFRNYMMVTPPDMLDGVETENGNPRHDSRNDLATAWAEKFGLIRTSGSDYHEYGDISRGGIVTDTPITTNDDLLAVLRGGNYTLITPKE